MKVVVDNHELVVEVSPDADQVVISDYEQQQLCGPYDWDDHVKLVLEGVWFVAAYNRASVRVLASAAHCNPPDSSVLVVERGPLHRIVELKAEEEVGEVSVAKAVDRAREDMEREAEVLGCDLNCNEPGTPVLFCRGHVNVAGLRGFVGPAPGSKLELGDVQVSVDPAGLVRVCSTRIDHLAALDIVKFQDTSELLEYNNCAVLHIGPRLFHVAYFVAFGSESNLPKLVV
jgi:hypothetical protein